MLGSMSEWQPYSEPLRKTLLRNGVLALILGIAYATFAWGYARRWPPAFLMMLWPTLGGHAVEAVFLNVIRPRIPSARAIQAIVRAAFWFVGGVGIGRAMLRTVLFMTNFRPAHWLPWWQAGLGFIGLELIVHTILALRKRGNFFDGRG